MFNFNHSRQADNELNQKVVDLLEGRGSELSRKLTKQMLKSFPSMAKLVAPEYQERLEKILKVEDI